MNEEQITTNGAPPENDHKVEELFLLHLRYREAQVVEVGANTPLLLDDEDVSWVVYSGKVDVFAVRLIDGQPAGLRTHLIRVNPGQAMFGLGLESTEDNIALLAVGINETQLFKIRTHRLQQMAQEEEFKDQIKYLINTWTNGLATALVSVLPPKDCIRLQNSQNVRLTQQQSVCAAKDVLWVKHDSGHSLFVGHSSLQQVNGHRWWPVTNRAWLQAGEDSEIQVIDTSAFLLSEPDWISLADFHRLILHFISLNLQKIAQTEREWLQKKTTTDREIVVDAFNRLATALKPEAPVFAEIEFAEPLLVACQLVAEQSGIKIIEPPALSDQQSSQDRLAEIARASRMNVRQVVLKDDWWRRDNGPLLGYLEETGQPVALLPKSASLYELYDPVRREKKEITEEVADQLSISAHMLYRPFPDKEITLLDLMRFSFQGYNTSDLRTILVTGVIISFLGLLVPLATKYLFDTVIPNADQGQLVLVTGGLFLVAVATALFQTTQAVAVTRLDLRLIPAIESAAWDRLLKLPVNFFRNYSAGELLSRLVGVAMIQKTLADAAIRIFLSTLLSIYTVILLFTFSSRLALAAVVLVLISMAATITAGYSKTRSQRKLEEAKGQLSSLVLQVITGINKFRASGNEGRAFAHWAREFSKVRQISFRIRTVETYLSVFNSGFMVFTSIVIFSVFAFSEATAISTGTFLAFFTAFGQLLAATLTISQVFLGILNIVPTYERLKPIFRTLPEVDEFKDYPGQLTGAIEVSHVSFRYREDAPDVLKDVSLYANPGEFIALVGPSGSGKSTLLRLLLGFEAPTSGVVYYNGHDLSGLDIREVRRQIGIVLQNSKLMPGSIFANIVGATPLSLDDAWEAAKHSALEDDVKAMPMGMNTIVGGGTLSGGQRQRLLIARALVNKPRVLFFDEATSALDNRTQAIVSESLENLQSTRIVIAHRLSTIMNADRIYVLQDGKVIQHGTYDELMNETGLFADLAHRQLA